MHPDNIKYTAVLTLFGPDEWTVMPMGSMNVPPMHQRHMVQALQHLIGKICHVYMDDIIIWSQNLADHEHNVTLVLEALHATGLYCSPKKTDLFCLEVTFLDHHISAASISADKSKVKMILNWPILKSASDVCSFLGLVRYILVFLPMLAEHTAILTPLTTKDAEKSWPMWTNHHADAFDTIKQLVISYALSRLPNDITELVTCADPGDPDMPELDFLEKPSVPTLSMATLMLSADASYVARICTGYDDDQFCICLHSNLTSTPSASERHGLLYIGNRLVIPRIGNIRAMLFHLAHDALGHFGTEKSYAALWDSYYWPRMCKDLETAYVPACSDCQRNKSLSQKPSGPLHPLPVPDGCEDSVAIDFVGPLPNDSGFNCIITMTDCAGSNIQIIPMQTDISAKDFASVFFDNWYCNHRLPLDIISDHDKLFILWFWHALHRLSGVVLKMSSSFHPETDRASEHTNKTVNQCLHHHVDHNQTGWVKALPLLLYGCSP
ncbi:hypothetical protein EWM64_g7262 [Hericium alpestre]|uniref:Reverse transcriptase domain-containing protein n=1 Tax=Hericium alpestre TaxID=135208 RepID=A0A4Y9ZR82_9AGAM|nr:hypothetical protein EWM64_g7262 [Hericium alpestre]